MDLLGPVALSPFVRKEGKGEGGHVGDVGRYSFDPYSTPIHDNRPTT